MTILIAGGSGFIGSYIRKRFEENGHDVNIVTRSEKGISWDVKSLSEILSKTDVLINLAGESINCRFTEEKKKLIFASRIETTAMLNEAVSTTKTPPCIWINVSATGIYNHASKNILDEYTPEYANDFLGNVAQKWEEEFLKTDFPNTRKIVVRTSVVFGKNGGVYPLLNRLSKLGFGGKQGSGKQMFSWVYIEDFYRIIQFAIKNETISGILNATAPHPVSNLQLMQAFQQSNHPIAALPAPSFILKIASYILNFQPDLILNGTNVFSQKLEDFDFQFDASDIKTALELLKN
ncbi:MAG: TIGR01777 family oxidoreductase [Paludibacteraceae bacterium]